jgi:hypothetical protein
MICPIMSKVIEEHIYRGDAPELIEHSLFEVQCKREKCACWNKYEDGSGFCGFKG